MLRVVDASRGRRSGVLRSGVRFRGQRLGPTAIAIIRRLIRSRAGWTRRRLARAVCEQFGWWRPNGEPAVRSCLGLLLLLERRRGVRLPAARSRPGRSAPLLAERCPPPPWCGFEPPGGSGRLVVRPIRPRERAVWRFWLQREHYLGWRPLVGESIGYVAFWDGRAVGVLGWTSGTLHNPARERFIGWAEAERLRGLYLVANNVRFLLWGERPERCLASRILAANLRRLSGDWQERYGHPVWLAETFVDEARFRGTCYRASNWREVGLTRGYGRSGWRYHRHDRPKRVFVYPLIRAAVARLRAGRLPVPGRAQPQEDLAMLDVERLPLHGAGGLFEVLGEVSDPRKRRGIRHAVVTVLALGVCAKLCGARSIEAMAQWAEDLPQETLRRFGCRRGRAPSEPTFRRLFGKLDPGELDRRLGAWVARQAGLAGQGVAIDGKTVRGSHDGTAAPVHLVGAVAHEAGVVVAQTRVAAKSNEITSVAPLLESLDVAGCVVTGDAIFAQQDIARYLVEQKSADYLFTVKDNQPTLRRDIEDLHLEAFPPSGDHDR